MQRPISPPPTQQPMAKRSYDGDLLEAVQGILRARKSLLTRRWKTPLQIRLTPFPLKFNFFNRLKAIHSQLAHLPTSTHTRRHVQVAYAWYNSFLVLESLDCPQIRRQKCSTRPRLVFILIQIHFSTGRIDSVFHIPASRIQLKRQHPSYSTSVWRWK